MKTTKMNESIFNYKGNKITFQLGNGDVMLNATEMSRHFNKMPKDYLKTKNAKDLINAISSRTNVLLTDLVTVVKGGNNSGTWMHEDVALDFAQWLSVDFKLWCNDRIKELLTTGKTQIAPTSTLDLLKLAVSEMEKKDKEIAVLKPKAEFLEKVFDADEKIDVGQAAKILELPFGRNTMFKKLRENGIFFKNKNEPKQEYIKRQYFQLREKYIARNNHEGFVVMKVLVTQKGLEFLSKLFNKTTPITTIAKLR